MDWSGARRSTAPRPLPRPGSAQEQRAHKLGISWHPHPLLRLESEPPQTTAGARAPARTRKVAGGEGRAPGRPRGRAGGTCQQFDLVSQQLHLRAAASGSALGQAGRGAREARSEAAGEPGARQAELPGARSALTASFAALPPKTG